MPLQQGQNINFLLCSYWHMFPLYPCLQAQTNLDGLDSGVGKHAPWFMHGLGSQGSTISKKEEANVLRLSYAESFLAKKKPK